MHVYTYYIYIYIYRYVCISLSISLSLSIHNYICIHINTVHYITCVCVCVCSSMHSCESSHEQKRLYPEGGAYLPSAASRKVRSWCSPRIAAGFGPAVCSHGSCDRKLFERLESLYCN